MVTTFRGRESALAIVVIAASAEAELFMRESFHRVGDQPFVMMCWAVIALGLAAIQFLFAGNGTSASRRIVYRWPLIATVAGYAWVVVGTTSYAPQQGSLATLALFYLPWVIGLLAGLLAAEKLSVSRWESLTRALSLGCVIYVGVQPIVVAWSAPAVRWPPLPGLAGTAEESGMPRDLVVFILLDEWNANAVEPVREGFRRAGLATSWKPLRPVGDGTSKVVPGLFTGDIFAQAKPCSPTATCSDGKILDFTAVQVSRQDIDIVGFYLPYCAIPGLRWCHRSVVNQSVTDLDRWRCGIQRRSSWDLGVSPEECDRNVRRPWNEMSEDVIDAVWNAPGWRKGGWMFLHLPLPHPPGRLHRADLAENYEDSLRRAGDLMERMSNVALHEHGRKVTFVVFSDHPLRQALWCKGQWVFTNLNCSMRPELDDTEVPVLIAGNSTLPSLEGILSNAEIFQLTLQNQLPRP